ncbi:hypothetical protein DFJ77DRAFT_508938 [Powellomyces hirtus]|nr:hypothetical protein DFJ77DRAFT_508938 [Powellomyces hirtus]
MEDLKEKYRDYMSPRDYAYFNVFNAEDRQLVLTEAKENLQEDNVHKIKMKTSGMEFLGIVSHELRTPLNSLIGLIDLMQADDMTNDQRLYIKTLEQSCTHLMSVVNRMQDLAALQQSDAATVNIIPFDIVATMTGVAEAMQHLSTHTGKGTQVVLDLDSNIPLSVNGDLTKIQQVLSNLVGIATTSSLTKLGSLKATFEPTTGQNANIHIVIKGVKTQTPQALLEGIALEFSFQDLFQPLTFNNLSQGIVISREFLAQLGSTLHMDIDEEGTLIFTFDLKLTYETSSDVARNSQSNRGEFKADRASVKILLAEDNKVNRQIVRKMLSKMGFANVDGAENGKEAIEKVEAEHFDIILMDCDMPLISGYEAAEHIRTVMKNNTIKIIALTANSTNNAKQRCISVGMDDYFTKPITIKTLSEMLHKWLPTVKLK